PRPTLFPYTTLFRSLRLLHIVAEGDVEAVALPGQLGGEQSEQGFLAERAVFARFRLGDLIGFLHRRRTVGFAGGEGLAAAEESECGEQREGSVHSALSCVIPGRGRTGPCPATFAAS